VQVELPFQVNAKASFLKIVKPNLKEFKIFQYNKGWLTFRESTEGTVMSHNLSEMIAPLFVIDPNTGEYVVDPITGQKIPHEPEDYGLYEMQRVWFVKVRGNVCQSPLAKKIANHNRDLQDTRMVWHQLCTHYENSMSSKLRSQELLWCVHTNQLANSNHHSTHQSYITGFSETIHQHQALQTDENKLSDQMCVHFLNNAMRGTTHLEGILDTYCTARKASGHANPCNITFEEYIERLIQAARPHGASLGQNRSRGSRSANLHSILGVKSDEEDDSEDEEDCGIEVCPPSIAVV